MRPLCLISFDKNIYSGFTPEDLHHASVLAEFSRDDGDDCTTTVTCNSTLTYRTADGTCNNENNPSWGMAGIQQRRILAAAYGLLICCCFFKTYIEIVKNND